MMRVIAFFVICLGCLFSSGCLNLMHGLIHPHSEITAPTFWIYDGHPQDYESKPLAIYQIIVSRGTKINDERIEWSKWHIFSPIRTGTDQIAWEMVYDPDGKSNLPSKPFACITHGKVPPGYIERIPALPLIPERLYAVMLRPHKDKAPNLGGAFIIRANAQGRPTHLEYRTGDGFGSIYVINRE